MTVRGPNCCLMRILATPNSLHEGTYALGNDIFGRRSASSHLFRLHAYSTGFPLVCAGRSLARPLCVKPRRMTTSAVCRLFIQLLKNLRSDGITALSLIHISEPTRRTPISYAVF